MTPFRDKSLSSVEKLRKDMASLGDVLTADGDQFVPLFVSYKTFLDQYIDSAMLKEVELGSNPATLAVAIRMASSTDTVPLADAVDHAFDALRDHILPWKHDLAEDSERLRARTTLVVLISGVLFVIGGLAMAGLIARLVGRPLSAMTGIMRRLADGDHRIDIPALGQTDEIGEMARAVRVFKEAAIEKARLEMESERQRQAAEAARAALEAKQTEAHQAQETVVSALATGLERLSKRDLTCRLTGTFPAAYEKLRADFNVMADSLRDALESIAAATNGISTGSDQIAHASDDLSRRTEQQAASLEETAAALNLITTTVKAMAANAGNASGVVVSTRAAAETSGVVVEQAVAAMTKIRDSSQQITNIIGVIDEIAFQTNLLALNAGVEAARAGDAGRGFAVVASEVRGLAQRSAEAAKEIKSLISASSSEVANGVALVARTGDALKQIIEKVAEMDTLVRDIHVSSREQATGLAEVNVAVTQMDQVIQQNAAMVEETTAAVHALKTDTQELTMMVDRFQIAGQTQSRNAVHDARARIATAMRA
jgi:methyl-accepting chemotaxis protein